LIMAWHAALAAYFRKISFQPTVRRESEDMTIQRPSRQLMVRMAYTIR
jgi:hypothetical protein